MRRALAAIILVTALAGCGTSVDVSDGPGQDGLCYQDRSKSFLGWDYSTSRNVINCGQQD
jgi:hypothetical protein